MKKKIKTDMDSRIKPEDDKSVESGRSMVEMLGTLAIIGVLSVGGIAGYTYAVSKSKANDILDGVSKRALVASQRMIIGKAASLTEYSGKKIGDYDVELKTEGYPSDQFGIHVSGVEQSVCERLQEQELSRAVKIELNGVELADATCAEEANAITYVFNEVLDPNKVGTDSGSGGTLWTPALCDVDEDCAGECEECVYNECIKKQGETCTCSADEMLYDYDWDEILDCFPCNYVYSIYTDDLPEGECGKCPNREVITTDDGDELCALKECAEGYFMDTYYQDCYSCNYGDVSEIKPEECAKCPNRESVDDGDGNYYCYLKECLGEYMMSHGECYPCDATGYIGSVTPADCAKCPNREMITIDYGNGNKEDYCGLKECPEGMIKDMYGECYRCGSERVFYGVDPTECAKCSGNNYFRDSHSKGCISCDDFGSTATIESECAKCPNREMIAFGSENRCALKECPDGYMHEGNLHDCYSCTTTYGIPTDDRAECARCTNRKWITTKAGFNACVLKECPDGKILDDWGDCYKPR